MRDEPQELTELAGLLCAVVSKIAEATAVSMAESLVHILTEQRQQADASRVSVEKLAVTIPEAAELLSLSAQTVRRMVGAGVLPSIETGFARRVIPMAALRRFVQPLDEAFQDAAEASHSTADGAPVMSLVQFQSPGGKSDSQSALPETQGAIAEKRTDLDDSSRGGS